MESMFLGRKQLPLVLLLVFLSVSNLHAAAYSPELPRPADPFMNPKDDPYNPLGYIASNTLTSTAFGAQEISTCVCRHAEY